MRSCSCRTSDGYLTALTAEHTEVVRAEPFDAVDLHIGMSFESDDDGDAPSR